jgi:septal ring factor EnvC (AmiA/AmiB activator)
MAAKFGVNSLASAGHFGVAEMAGAAAKVVAHFANAGDRSRAPSDGAIGFAGSLAIGAMIILNGGKPWPD